MGNPTLVLLPGLDGDGFYFSAFRNALPLDIPSRMLAYPPHLTSVAAIAEWVCNELDTETDYVIAGESMGGPVAILVAEALGNQAKGVVLCATFCRPPLPGLILTLAKLLYPYCIRATWMAHFLNFFVCNGGNLKTAQQLQEVLCRLPDAVAKGRIYKLRMLDLRPELTSLTLPVLVIEAQNDRIVWHGKCRNLPLSGITVTVESAHGLMGMHPQAAAKAISDFIKTKI